MIYLAALLAFAIFATSVSAQSLVSELCTLIGQIRGTIFLLALALVALGGALYALAHLMPQQQKGGLQNYGMGMIIGGVVGVVLVLLAPFILGAVASGAGAANALTAPLSSTCTSLNPFGI